jgi:sarcosine oxidase, subunit gamma
VMLLSNEAGDASRFADWEQSWRFEDREGTYPVPRRDSHAWFALEGSPLPSMMAKICGVDLRPERFSDLAIAQTSVARINAIVLRADRPDPIFHLLADSASAAYFLDCLRDAALEFDQSIA